MIRDKLQPHGAMNVHLEITLRDKDGTRLTLSKNEDGSVRVELDPCVGIELKPKDVRNLENLLDIMNR